MSLRIVQFCANSTNFLTLNRAKKTPIIALNRRETALTAPNSRGNLMSRVAQLRQILSRARALEKLISQTHNELRALESQALQIGRLLVCVQPQCDRQLFVPAGQENWPSRWWASDYQEDGGVRFMCPECAARLGLTAQLCARCTSKVSCSLSLQSQGWHRLGAGRRTKQKSKAKGGVPSARSKNKQS